MKLISFIIVNYNTASDTEELLHCISQLSYKNIEVIVVDNGSVGNQIQDVASRFPQFTFSFLSTNVGFAGGNNVGINLSKGEYLFFINNDTVIFDNTVEELVKTLDNNKKIAAVSPKIKFYDNPSKIQYAGSTVLSKITVRNEHIGFDQNDSKVYSTIKKTAFVHGAAMMVRKSAIDEIGPMPVDYFLYYEELDWCEQFKAKGYELWYNGTVSILHKVSKSTGKISGFKNYYINRNRILFVRKNYKKGFAKILALGYLTLLVFPKNVVKNIFNPALLKSSYKALLWNIKNETNSNLI